VSVWCLGLCLAFWMDGAGEPPGAYVLCGGGTLPPAARERFLSLAGGAKAVIVVIPTASAAADNPDERESFLAPWQRLGPARVVWLHTRDRKEADTDAFCQCLTSATGVWISGGDQSRLTSTYLGTRTEAALRGVLRRGGVVGGTSAGAAVMGHPMIRGGQTQADLGPGFGLLPQTIVDQHFFKRQRESRLKDALSQHPRLRGLGIDEDTAVVIHAGRLEVLGRSAVKLYQRPEPNGPWVEQLIKANDSVPFSLGGRP